MDLKSYFFSLPTAKDRAAFAEKAGTKKMYVHQLICTKPKTARRPSTDLAQRLHKASGGVIPLSSLRPDVWPA